MTLSKGLRSAIEAAKRFIDMPEEPSFLAREKECLLALHRIRALIGHMERIAAQIAVRRLRRRAERFVRSTKLLEHALSFVQQPLLEVLKRLLIHSFGLFRAVGRR